ncbi:hypothetical protein FKM82_024510 [Ascaphus truei]
MIFCAERKYGTCEIDWAQATRSAPYKCYVIGVLLWGFFLPVSVMVFCYVSIIRTVHASHKSSRRGDISQRQLTMERDITRVSFVICTGFLLAWSPYAVISIWSACGYQVPALTSVVATLFAKSASFYNPIIYLGLSPKFRQELRALLCCPQQERGPGSCKKPEPTSDLKPRQWEPLSLHSGGTEAQAHITQAARVHMSGDEGEVTLDQVPAQNSTMVPGNPGSIINVDMDINLECEMGHVPLTLS